MNKILNGFVLVSILFLIAGCHEGAHTSGSENYESLLNQTPMPRSESLVLSDISSVETRRYLGCWNGMGGGKLRITDDRIIDLGTKESSVYTERALGQISIKGLQTNEQYLLELERDFPKSFLAKFVLMVFNVDGTVGIATFDSHDEYLKNKISGQGLFEKTECSNH